MPLDPLSARYAAHRSWAATRDRTARTAPERAGLDVRFEREAWELLGNDATDAQVAQSATSLRKAHFADLARKSAEARRKPR